MDYIILAFVIGMSFGGFLALYWRSSPPKSKADDMHSQTCEGMIDEQVKELLACAIAANESQTDHRAFHRELVNGEVQYLCEEVLWLRDERSELIERIDRSKRETLVTEPIR